MRLVPSDLYLYLRPEPCSRRVYLRQQGVEEAEPGPYEVVLRRLGLRHEQAHLSTFPDYVDLREGGEDKRLKATQEQIAGTAPVLYQPLFSGTVSLRGLECRIVGAPDFLIRQGRTFAVRDSKISRRITEKDHPEIVYQVGLYGWLYEQTTGVQPAGLEVYSGLGEIVDIPYDGGDAAFAALEAVVVAKGAEEEPYGAVGWSKCTSCGFFGHCWTSAEESRDVALVYGVDQGLARQLHDDGIGSFDQLLSAFDEDALTDYQRPWGSRMQRVGKKASSILVRAQAMSTGSEIDLLGAPALPNAPSWVMFDLEGLPPHLDELEKIYLWGLQVFGEDAGPFQAATAGFGTEGDREGWLDFLHLAAAIVDDRGDISFVHWAPYEKTQITRYIERYGDPDGIAARVLENLLDLLPITRASVALPLPSYSLKVVERYVGFEREQTEYGGDWSMAKYIEATETEDEQRRAEVMAEILQYNREDLEATWHVLRWLRAKAR
jgi:predicted RecB family nuclease